MPYDGTGHYHLPPRSRRKRDEHERMGEALREHAPMSERVENRLLAVSKPLNEMSQPELFAHFHALTDRESRNAILSHESNVWSGVVLFSFALELTARLVSDEYRREASQDPCADPCNSSCDCTLCEAKRESGNEKAS